MCCLWLCFDRFIIFCAVFKHINLKTNKCGWGKKLLKSLHQSFTSNYSEIYLNSQSLVTFQISFENKFEISLPTLLTHQFRILLFVLSWNRPILYSAVFWGSSMCIAIFLVAVGALIGSSKKFFFSTIIQHIIMTHMTLKIFFCSIFQHPRDTFRSM